MVGTPYLLNSRLARDIQVRLPTGNIPLAYWQVEKNTPHQAKNSALYFLTIFKMYYGQTFTYLHSLRT
jgi:hypothetical protein